MVVALGDDDHQARIAAVGQTSVGRHGHEVDVDARREHSEHRTALEVDPCGGGGRRLAEVVDLDGRRHRRELGRADQRRVGHSSGPQPSLGRQPVVGMVGRGCPAVSFHHGDDARQGIRRRLVAVQHALGLPVVLADANLEHWTVLVENGACHLEAEDLTAEHPVLDDRFGAGGADDVGEGRHLWVEWRLRRVRLRLGGRQRRAVDAPDRRRAAEGRGAAGKNARVLVDEQVEVLDREPLGPQQGAAQRPLWLVFGKDPARAVVNRGGPSGKALGAPVPLAPVAPDEGAQLGLTERLAALTLGYFLFPLRAP